MATEKQLLYWESMRGKPSNRKGKPMSLEQRKKLEDNGNFFKKKGSMPWNKGIKAPWLSERNRLLNPKHSGENHWKWIKDRNLVKTTDRDHQSSRYKQWKKEIHTRDKAKCRIENEDCSGRLEAHHILPWSQHPELRYEVNNGISLCHYHHPRKREEERRLAPTFQEMVSRPAYELAHN